MDNWFINIILFLSYILYFQEEDMIHKVKISCFEIKFEWKIN